MKKLAIASILLAFVLIPLVAQTPSTSTVPGPPTDPIADLPPYQTAAAQTLADALASWTWARAAIVTLGTNQFNDEAQLATMSASLNTLNADVNASNTAATIVNDPQIGNAALSKQIATLQSEIQSMTVSGAAPLIPHIQFANCIGAFKAFSSSEGPAAGGYSAGATFDCTDSLPSAGGKFQVAIRAATPLAGCSFNVQAPVGSTIGVVNVPATGGWLTFATAPAVTVAVPAGQTSLRFIPQTACANLLWAD